jgi:hypothetical protein
MRKVGVNPEDGMNHAQRLADTGFVQVHEVHGKWATGSWAKGEREKRLGLLFAKDVGENIYGISAKMFTGLLGWTETDLKILCKEFQKEVKDPRVSLLWFKLSALLC